MKKPPSCRKSLVFLTFLSFVLLSKAMAFNGGDYSSGRNRGGIDAKPPDNFGGPSEGQRAPDFSLESLSGEKIRLADYVGKQPVVLELGSLTCPVFRQKHGGMKRLYRKYSDQAAFFVIYVTEAHPQGDPSPYTGREWVTEDNERAQILYRQPKQLAERKELAEKARQKLSIQIPIILDDMSNSTWKKYGEAPNAAYLIGLDGRIKLRQGWFKSGAFEKALASELK